MFGNDIIQQARSENSVIPNVVLMCVREVESRGNIYTNLNDSIYFSN